MKKQTQLQNRSVVLFAAVTALFLLFFLYINHYEGIDIYRARPVRAYEMVEEYVLEQVKDETAPAGVRNVYRWNLDAHGTNENCLCILSVHQTIQVYFDGELMYSMAPAADNRIAGSPGTNWSTVAVYPSDHGTEVTVVVTPLFASVVDYGAEFWYGSHFSILFDRLSQELPQLFTAVLCMILGAFILLVQIYFSFTTNTQAWDMFFLGSFAVVLGLWRFTYADAISILYPESPMTLGYITIGALFLLCTPLSLLASTFVGNDKVLLILSCICSGISLLVLVLQVLGIWEWKELLTVCHIMLIATICVIFMAMWRQRKSQHYQKKRGHPFILVGAGIVLDMISFYRNQTTSDAVFTILAFILYAIIMFVFSTTETSRKAYTDSRTGLANRFRWNELMDDNSPIPEPFGILLMDLNGLKRVNDSLGHEAGDRMIFHFANILRNTLPVSSVICRWGGDEFAVMLTGTNRRQLDRYIDALARAAKAYNAANPGLQIHYAAGSALSAEHPTMTRAELFQLADEEMYRNKQIWYGHKHAVKE